jgi:hypothetical protein
MLPLLAPVSHQAQSSLLPTGFLPPAATAEMIKLNLVLGVMVMAVMPDQCCALSTSDRPFLVPVEAPHLLPLLHQLVPVLYHCGQGPSTLPHIDPMITTCGENKPAAASNIAAGTGAADESTSCSNHVKGHLLKQ